MDSELLLIDLSSIAHPIWHMSQSEPDPNATSTKIVDRIRTLAAQHKHAAVCCDAGKSFRCEIDPAYKAQRPEADAALHHQITLARETLAADGFPVWRVPGFEADDVIATATAKTLAIEGASVLIASADKDLLQLVNHRVRAKSVRDGSIIDADVVKAKFGIGPEQMQDYLALVGDASDNIIGAKGIGPKTAVEILTLFGSLDALYAALDRGEAKLKPSIKNSLIEFRDRKDTVRSLIALRNDVEIPFEEIAAERVPKDAAAVAEETDMDSHTIEMPTEAATGAAAPASADAVAPRDATPATPAANGGNGHANGNGESKALAVREPDALAPPPAEWGKQLEPRSMREAQGLATAMFQARLFNGYGTPQAVLSTIMAGRELGMQAVASLRGFHIVEGKHALAADLIRGLVLRSGLADYFKCVERSPEKATFKTHRKDDPDPDPTVLTYTIEDGRTAFGFRADLTEKERADRERAWKASGWGRNPADMCVARAGAKLARLVYPEVSFGLYAPEEFD